MSASFPAAPVAVAQKPGQLRYTKIVIQNQFLAESCSIGDYNGDGTPDVSAGRIWYEGPDFKKLHTFRDGHGVLPSAGAALELNTGVSDDWADYPWDMDGDGDTDIVNIAQCDVPENHDPNLPDTGGANDPKAAGTPNKMGTVQVHATAVWYENPGKATVETTTTNWTAHLMHADVRMEQHEMVDMNGDGYPEILGACRDCGMGDTKGYYQGDPTKPTNPWTYHQVSGHFPFPVGKLGLMHGLGAGDINGDGLPDWMDRSGAYLQQPQGTWNLVPCTGKNTPVGCGWIQAATPLLPMGFSQQGLADTAVGNKGPSHMFAADMDKDGLLLTSWRRTGPTGRRAFFGISSRRTRAAATGCGSFKRIQFMGDSMRDNPADVAKWGAGFTEAPRVPGLRHGRRRSAGRHRGARCGSPTRTASPTPDPDGTPYLYVFKNVGTPDPNSGVPSRIKPILVDGNPRARWRAAPTPAWASAAGSRSGA